MAEVLIRATIHLPGLQPGDFALVDGDDQYNRDMLEAGYFVLEADEAPAPAEAEIEAAW